MADTLPDVSRFWAEYKVQHELNAIRERQNVVYPAVARSGHDEAENEGTYWDPDCDPRDRREGRSAGVPKPEIRSRTVYGFQGRGIHVVVLTLRSTRPWLVHGLS